MKNENDILKGLGFNVGGNQSLIHETKTTDAEIAKSIEAGLGEQSGRVGADNARDRLEKGLLMFAMPPKVERAKKEPSVDENLKNTHGEDWHDDNDKMAEKMVSTTEEIDHRQESDEDEFPAGKYIAETKYVNRSMNALEKSCAAKKACMEDTPFARMKRKYDEKLKMKKAEKIEMDKKEFKEEHEKLLDVLHSPSRKDDKKEAKKQSKEMKQELGKSVESSLDDLIKGHPMPSGRVSKRAPRQPKDPAQAKQERAVKKELMGKWAKKSDLIEMTEDKNDPDLIANVHENYNGVNERLRPAPIVEKSKKFKFVKSVGIGGIMFDFGSKTGNPIADNATALLNQFSDPVQNNNAQYQADSYRDALASYCVKGEAHTKDATMFGNIDKAWNEQLGKSTDQQVQEMFDKGQLDASGPAVINDFNKTEIKMGGEVIKATSETDAAVIEMMRQMESQGVEGGITIDTSAGAVGVTAGE
jgi:hypothetical protein